MRCWVGGSRYLKECTDFNFKGLQKFWEMDPVTQHHNPEDLNPQFSLADFWTLSVTPLCSNHSIL
jgi:hypothetical protein